MLFLVAQNLGGWYPPREKLEGVGWWRFPSARREPLPRSAFSLEHTLYPIYAVLDIIKTVLHRHLDASLLFSSPLNGTLSHGALAGYQELRRKLARGQTGKWRKRENEDRDCKKFQRIFQIEDFGLEGNFGLEDFFFSELEDLTKWAVTSTAEKDSMS